MISCIFIQSKRLFEVLTMSVIATMTLPRMQHESEKMVHSSEKLWPKLPFKFEIKT